MRKALLGFVALFLISSMSFSQEKLKTYTSELGKFAIEYQGEINERTQDKETSKVYRATYRVAGMGFMTSSTVHENKAEDASKMLKLSLETLLKTVKGDVVSKKDITQQGQKGLHVVLDLKENGVQIVYRVFVKDAYQYQLLVFGKAEEFDINKAMAYMNSFKMTK